MRKQITRISAIYSQNGRVVIMIERHTRELYSSTVKHYYHASFHTLERLAMALLNLDSRGDTYPQANGWDWYRK